MCNKKKVKTPIKLWTKSVMVNIYIRKKPLKNTPTIRKKIKIKNWDLHLLLIDWIFLFSFFYFYFPSDEQNLKKKNNHVCWCGKSFATNFNYQRHYRAVHTDSTPFACTYPDCKKRFKEKGKLRDHERRKHNLFVNEKELHTSGKLKLLHIYYIWHMQKCLVKR